MNQTDKFAINECEREWRSGDRGSWSLPLCIDHTDRLWALISWWLLSPDREREKLCLAEGLSPSQVLEVIDQLRETLLIKTDCVCVCVCVWCSQRPSDIKSHHCCPRACWDASKHIQRVNLTAAPESFCLWNNFLCLKGCNVQEPVEQNKVHF